MKVCALIMAVVSSPAFAGGDTWYINPVSGNDTNTGTSEIDAFATIGAGITAAMNGDTVLLLPGTYTGPGNQSISLQGKTISVSGRDGAASTIIDIMDLECASSPLNCEDRAFEITGGQGRGLVIEGLTIRNALVDTQIIPGDGIGGAVLIDSASPSFIACVFENNRVFGQFGAQGGAVYAIGDPLFQDCQFIDSLADAGTAGTGGGTGGAIRLISQNADLIGCTFVNNTCSGSGPADSAGAAIAIRGGASVVDCLFEDNRLPTSGRGGALYADTGEPTDSITIDRCEFIRNDIGYSDTSSEGGAAWLAVNSEIRNSLFVGNRVLVDEFSCEGPLGAAIRYGSVFFLPLDPVPTHKIINSTIADQQGPCGDVAIGVFPERQVEITNSVIWGNPIDVGGQIAQISVNNSIIESGFGGASNADPMFAAPGSDDYRLSAGSPAIDAGDNASVTGAIDLDGNARRFDDPLTPDTGIGAAPIVDLGAYEFGSGPGPCSPADLDAPFGTLDFSDVTAFLVAFSAMSPEADLASPFGTYDFSDVVAFLGAFGAGCP